MPNECKKGLPLDPFAFVLDEGGYPVGVFTDSPERAPALSPLYPAASAMMAAPPLSPWPLVLLPACLPACLCAGARTTVVLRSSSGRLLRPSRASPWARLVQFRLRALAAATTATAKAVRVGVQTGRTERARVPKLRLQCV